MEGERETLAGWKDLPMELLLRIMSLVDDRVVIKASAVCMGWRESLCFGLTSLRLSWCKNNLNSLVQSLVPKFTRLQVIILRQINVPQIEDNAVEMVANHCHDLRELDLGKCSKLTDRSLYSLGHGCPHLTKLNICGCAAFSDTALAYLACCCKILKILNLSGCERAATDRALQSISYHCKGLQSLNLGLCENATNEGIASLSVGCPELRVLNLSGCIFVTDESVIAIADNCPCLHSLNLQYCQNITDRAMYSLAESRAKIRHGNWRKEEDDDVGLVKLNVAHCTALTAAAVQAVCDSFPGLHTCLKRPSLIIDGCPGLTSVRCACVDNNLHYASRTSSSDSD